jgi:hypothetical protein
MLQNRVDPQGNIISTSARGAWMGNRGQLHGKGKTILRPFKLKAWITCLLEFKGWCREVMSPNLYTELFFLDEATAFAAGHRPCFECRRKDYDRFKSCWLSGNPEYGFNEKTSIREIDDILHRERIGSDDRKVTFTAILSDLPDGTFIELDSEPFLLANGQIYQWTPFGYEKGIEEGEAKEVTVITPRSTVNAIRAGYFPQMAAQVTEID